MSGPSEKAIAWAQDHWANPDVKNIAAVSVRKAHDPALCLDRSVCLRDVVQALEDGYQAHGDVTVRALVVHPADFIEREFGGEG